MATHQKACYTIQVNLYLKGFIMDIQNAFQGLDALLDQLQAEKIEFIEYGDPNMPGMSLSNLRIRFIPTLGGMQFAIKELHRGMEGSGIYYQPQEREQLKAMLTTMLERYHTPNPAIRELLKSLNREVKDTPLSFFASSASNDVVGRALKFAAAQHRKLPSSSGHRHIAEVAADLSLRS